MRTWHSTAQKPTARDLRFFEAEMDARAQARRRLEMDLRKAMLGGALEVLSASRAASRAERFWPSKRYCAGRIELGFIPPSEFIPIAEEPASSRHWAHMLRQACADASAARVSRGQSLSAAVRTGNLFGGEAGARSDWPSPKRLELEITETLLLERPITCRNVARAARTWRASRWTISAPVTHH